MKKVLLLLLAAISTATAQPRQLDYQAIRKGTFNAPGVSGLRPMNDGEHYTTQNGNAIVRYRYIDGEVDDTVFNADKYKPNLKITSYQFSPDESLMLIATDRDPIYRHSALANYWIFDKEKNTVTPLSTKGKQQEATISPDGSKVAFVRDNNIYVYDIAKQTEKQITTDGVKGEIINGIPDWVYEEEYSFSRAFQWSPSSDAIAFYRFDESRVKMYSMNTFNNQLYPVNFDFKYPKAGQDNSIVQIRVFNLNVGTTKIMDIGTEQNQYIPRIEWTPRKDELAIHRINRLQNHYEMLYANGCTGVSQVVYSESSPRYIERINDQKVTFLPDAKRFIMMNENDGWKHLYLYEMTGKLIRQITRGNWEVTGISGIDHKSGEIYYTSTQTSELGRDLSVVNFNRSGKSRMLTAGDGYYSISMSKGCKYYISTFSNTTTPTRVTLHNSDGKLLRTLRDNAEVAQRIKEWEMPVKEFIRIPVNGVELNAFILKPADFDPNKKYPLFMTQYSGPGSQQVANKWGVSWEAALLKEGYLVACVDGRGTGYRGEEFRKCTYGNLGNLEVKDQIAAAQWFGKQSFVDSKRIGIYGWSYGGFMALNCILQGADVFAAAVAVAPVTSWRYYDTIYTEIFNGLPQDNPKGYDDNSPISHADKLKGKLLLAHGTADDNVHIQNSYEMIEKLVKAGKDFEWVIYPDKNHGMGSSHDHLINKAINFVKVNL